MIATKERPILFSGEMVRAILDGRKTQTRRMVSKMNCDCDRSAFGRLVWDDKDSPDAKHPAVVVDCGWYGERDGYAKVLMRPHPDDPQDNVEYWTRQRVPSIWSPGDRLWVREAWRSPKRFDHLKPRDVPVGTPIFYEVDGGHDFRSDEVWGRRRSSRFMCRWMSRLTLEITGVRVERVQDITEEDAIAEGAETEWVPPGKYSFAGHRASERSCFSNLWDSINGPGSWAANQFVWVVEFKKVDGK